MEKNINYYTFAENDYLFLKANIDENRIGNAMTSIAQNICERYLKHLIELYCVELDCTNVLKTHSLKRIIRFLEDSLDGFEIDKGKVILADGYYFSARYPGDESFFVNEEDVQVCWEAVQETKRAVDTYLESHPKERRSILD
jgi:HEPN domain-containing protein